MPAGTDTYAVALTGGRTEGTPYPIGTLTLPPGNSTARIEYSDRSAIRDVGQFVGLGTAVIGVIYATVQLVALTRCPEESCKKSHIRGAALGGGLCHRLLQQRRLEPVRSALRPVRAPQLFDRGQLPQPKWTTFQS